MKKPIKCRSALEPENPSGQRTFGRHRKTGDLPKTRSTIELHRTAPFFKLEINDANDSVDDSDDYGVPCGVEGAAALSSSCCSMKTARQVVSVESVKLMPPELIITPAQRNGDETELTDAEENCRRLPIDSNTIMPEAIGGRSIVAELPPLIGSAGRNGSSVTGSKKRGHTSVRKSVVPVLRFVCTLCHFLTIFWESLVDIFLPNQNIEYECRK